MGELKAEQQAKKTKGINGKLRFLAVQNSLFKVTHFYVIYYFILLYFTLGVLRTRYVTCYIFCIYLIIS
jgi:hypothetical protein